MSQCSIVSPKDPNAPPKVMTFDGAYYTDSTTEAIYNEISFPLVEVSLKYYTVKGSSIKRISPDLINFLQTQ